MYSFLFTLSNSNLQATYAEEDCHPFIIHIPPKTKKSITLRVIDFDAEAGAFRPNLAILLPLLYVLFTDNNTHQNEILR